MPILNKGMGMEEFVDYLIELADKQPEIFEQIVIKKDNKVNVKNSSIAAGIKLSNHG